MDDIDFKAKVTRSEFEALCEDLFDRVPGPVKEAFAAAEMTLVRSFKAPYFGFTQQSYLFS